MAAVFCSHQQRFWASYGTTRALFRPGLAPFATYLGKCLSASLGGSVFPTKSFRFSPMHDGPIAVDEVDVLGGHSALLEKPHRLLHHHRYLVD